MVQIGGDILDPMKPNDEEKTASDQPLTMTEQAAMIPPVTSPEEAFKRYCEVIDKLVGENKESPPD